MHLNNGGDYTLRVMTEPNQTVGGDEPISETNQFLCLLVAPVCCVPACDEFILIIISALPLQTRSSLGFANVTIA